MKTNQIVVICPDCGRVLCGGRDALVTGRLACERCRRPLGFGAGGHSPESDETEVMPAPGDRRPPQV